MPTQAIPALEIDVDFGGSVGEVTGRFEFPGGDEGSWSVEPAIRTGYLLNNSFDDIAALFTELTGDGDADRKGLHFDVGGGEHAVQLQFQVPVDGTNPDTGQIAQWGSSSDPTVGPNRHTATGADRTQQMQTFMEYLRVGGSSSLTPARFTWGEYCPGGYLDDYLAVAIEEPSVMENNVDPYWADGSMVVVETRDLSLGGDEDSIEEAG